MFPDNLLALATRRHELSRIQQLSSWCSLGDGRWAIAVTTIEASCGPARPGFVRYSTGVPSPLIAAALAAHQHRIDELLDQTFGEAWQAALRECALLSLACESGEAMLFSCRANAPAARQIVTALDESLQRVRAGLIAPSREFPRLAAVVDGICRRPASNAA